MKYIQKNDEPEKIIDWKCRYKNKHGRQPRYEDIEHDQKLKKILKNSLILEQGGICCNCIGYSDSHIEHFRPKGKREYAALSLEYENLLASCQGYHNEEENCGHRKANEFDENLMISPLENNCEKNFKFSSRGKIMAADKNVRAQYTIESLRLDTPQLNAARETAMWESGAMEDISEEECRELLERFNNKDKNGCYAEFSDAIIYHLRKRLRHFTES